jgi:uncharacterized protein (TIGR00255 family)
MLKSMTGYGAAQAENETYLISAEIRCVNSKFLDVSLRLPKQISDRELEIRNLLNPLERGKLGVQLDIQSKGESKTPATVNTSLLKSYFQLLSQTAQDLGTQPSDLFRMALQMPEVIQSNTDTEQKEVVFQLVQQSVVQAVASCEKFRLSEGKSLEDKFEGYIQKIKALLAQVEAQDPQRALTIRSRLQTRLEELHKDELFDRNRFEQEMLYYIERLDISEEKVRLATHLDYFLKVMGKEENQGRKLNFISQEIGREINTIGSKANDALIQRYVVEMKEELEKIKEQVMNVL